MKLKNNDLVGLAVTIGFSGFLAFAYGFGIYLFPVLGPDMRLDLDFSYTEMGFVAAGIQAGFIFSSAVTGAVAPRFGELRVIYLSMLFCGVCLLALSQVRTSAEAALVLVFVGFVPASTWIPMVAVVRRYIQFNRRGLVFGLLSGSGGYGAIINGQVVPILQHEIGWRGVWIVTGSTTIGMTLACILLFRFLGVTDKQKPSPEAAATLPA
ncbi:MAG: MFS transporter, partial [Pseudomonadota bacterium]